MEIITSQCQRWSGDSVEAVFFINIKILTSEHSNKFPLEHDRDWVDVENKFAVRLEDHVCQ